MPVPTPASFAPFARSAPFSAKASRKVKIGAVETRMPVSDEAIRSSPRAISESGPAACTKPRTTIGPSLPRNEPSTPR
jgi:hypothetical protein